MKYCWNLTFFLFLPIFIVSLSTPPLFSLEDSFFCDRDKQHNLMSDLLIVSYWNQRLNERFPVTYNHLLQGGYFSMPSARMGTEGEIGFGYSHVPPYRNYNLRFQVTDFLEISGNYRIFSGVKDPVFGHLGFGDFSDKGANIKLCLFSPEASRYKLPGLAIGFEDVIGTRAFKADYIVLTQVLLDYNLEISLGYGAHRIRGFFGGLSWMPFRHSQSDYLKGLSFSLEYDAIPYRDEGIEKHPKGRTKRSPFNIGLKYHIWDTFDFSIAYIRGDTFAFSASTYYNFGLSKGIIPKVEDPLPYRAPLNIEAISSLRPLDALVQDFLYAMLDQGLEITEIWLGYDEKNRKTLRFRIVNMFYRDEQVVRHRLDSLLAALTPEDIDRVIVVIDADEVPIQEYQYDTSFLRAYQRQEIGRYELTILTPLREASAPDIYRFSLLFKREKDLWNLEILPKVHTLFGSAKGKFKYAVGLSANINGFLYYDIFYNISLGYFFASNLYDINDIDRLNPSQIINVRTDIINYFKQKCITVDTAYAQKIWNWGNGLYSRLTIGLFEQEYGGIGAEWLRYPVNSCWAIGMEAAIVRKRSLTGIGFTDKVRKLEGFHRTYRRFIGSQYFINFYYDWECINLEFKISIGKFLANDYGVRNEISRYFPSGLRLSFWYTYTNANDKINGQTYHDTGFYLSLPLDIFYTKSSRSRWGYGMSAWLRDVGAKAYTGSELYYFIDNQRQ